MYEFKLPDLGEGIHEAEILKWFVREGDEIAPDQDLVEVETDKAAVVIPSPAGGRVERLAGAAGDEVRVGQVLVVLDDGARSKNAPPVGEPPRGPTSPSDEDRDAPRPGATAESSEAAEREAAPSPRTHGPVPAAPATRRLARELGVELRLVPATGPGGRVTEEDLRRFAARAKNVEEQAFEKSGVPPREGAKTDGAGEGGPAHGPSAPRRADAPAIPFLELEPLPDFAAFGPVERIPLRSIRRKVARKMVTSMTLVPHVAHMDEADVTELETFRLREREKRIGEAGERLTLLPFVVKALVAGLREAPIFNASLDPFAEEIVHKRYVNVGVAVDTDHGLVVPVLRDADRRSVLDIASRIEELARGAREGRLSAEDFRGGTFTVTNVGPLGGTAMIPAINYPEVAILGMGRVQEKPVVRDGEIVVRKVLPLTLAFDHRVADGADAARFVHELILRLSDPGRLLLEC